MGLRLICMNPEPRFAKAQPGAGIIQRFQRFDVESMRL
jgi:hypothetical protein